MDERIIAVAGYERWSGEIAQLQVSCHPGYRRRGLAAEPLTAAIAAALGFVEYGWMATVRVRLPGNAV